MQSLNSTKRHSVSDNRTPLTTTGGTKSVIDLDSVDSTQPVTDRARIGMRRKLDFTYYCTQWFLVEIDDINRLRGS